MSMVNQYKAAFDVTCPTARSDLKKLEGLGIVQILEDEEMQQITYYCFQIYPVTFDYSSLVANCTTT